MTRAFDTPRRKFGLGLVHIQIQIQILGILRISRVGGNLAQGQAILGSGTRFRVGQVT